MFYLTYAEPPSGVYDSQVTDVIRFLNESCHGRVRLLAFISIRNYKANKEWIKKRLPDAIVLPMLPKATWWKFNTMILAVICLFLKPTSILARNVIACNMALRCKRWGLIRKVGFDGRGAIAAEWTEYEVTVHPSWKREIHALEKNAVNQSDAQLAVSQELVLHWTSNYQYKKQDYVVIPCTLNSVFSNLEITAEMEPLARNKYGFDANDIILAYSGSTAGWQSFSLVLPFLQHYLRQSPRYKALFLSKQEPNIQALQTEFPEQVKQLWVNHNEVPLVLAACDVGILIREQSETNRVASPTKFAEYLAAGLPVAISENLGDYSAFVVNHNAGIIVNSDPYPLITRTTTTTRQRLNRIILDTGTKEACRKQYMQLLERLKV